MRLSSPPRIISPTRYVDEDGSPFVHVLYVSPCSSVVTLHCSSCGHGCFGCFSTSRSTLVAMVSGFVALRTAKNENANGAITASAAMTTTKIHHGGADPRGAPCMCMG